MHKDYDVVVVGAGLIGSSFVVAMQQQGLKIAVLEKHLPDIVTQTDQDALKDTRPISLSYGSHVILKTLSIWPALAADACAIEAVEVSEQGALGAIHFTAKEQDVDALGYVVPYGQLHRALYQAMAAQADVDVISINDLSAITINEEGGTLSVSTAAGEQEFHTRLLVGCDGTHSRVRELLAVQVDHKDAKEVAMTATLSFAHQHEQQAFERFTEKGTLAILPLPNKKQCGLVWTMSNAMHKQVEQWDEQALQAFIADVFIGKISAIAAIKKGVVYPLKTSIAKKQILPGVVLLGNSAHTLYPLAAQGFNLGLRDVAALCEVLSDAEKKQQTLGRISVLQTYLQWREQDQKRITHLTNGIITLFDARLPFAKKARGLGMLMTDLLSPIKKRLARRTMGIAGRLPKLARGIRLWS